MRQRRQRVASRLTIFGSASVLLGLGALALTSAASADTVVATTVPFTFMGTNACVIPPEDFVGTGNVHLVISSNLSMSGMAQSHLQANLQGLQATTISNKKYQVPDSSTLSFEFDLVDAARFYITLESLAQFIRAGEDATLLPGDDFFEHFLAHATVNANGIVTVDDFTNDTRCR